MNVNTAVRCLETSLIDRLLNIPKVTAQFPLPLTPSLPLCIYAFSCANTSASSLL